MSTLPELRGILFVQQVQEVLELQEVLYPRRVPVDQVVPRVPESLASLCLPWDLPGLVPQADLEDLDSLVDLDLHGLPSNL